MYIFSQDKKAIMEIGNVEISENLTMKKEEKYALVALSKRTTNFKIIAKYPTKEAAINEMKNIFAALSANQEVYEVR